MINFENLYTELKISKFGVGVFSLIDIPMNENPFPNERIFEWVRLPKEIYENLPKNQQILISRFCRINASKIYIPSISFDSLDNSWYVNHSDTPNLKYDRDGYTTLKDIKEGDELTYKYPKYLQSWLIT